MESEFLQLCKDGEVEKVKQFYSEKRAHIDATDNDGMSGLMHAAYCGHIAVCTYLLEEGAEVEKETSNDYYTALMLATLAGQAPVVELLLKSGANPEKRNKNGKTSANLAAMIGSKECLAVLNNYLPLHDVVYHTKPRNLDTNDFLPHDLAPVLHHICCMNNLNPVKILLYVKDHCVILDPANKVQVMKTLKRIIEKQFKIISNEIMALKTHYIVCTLEEVEKRSDGIDGAIKHLLTGRKFDGFAINVELLVRRAIITFPFNTSQLVGHLIRALAPITPGEGKPALYHVMTKLNGRHVDVDEFACRTCGEMGAEKRCSACKQVFYCNAVCQKMHWFTHKKVCDMLSRRKPKNQPQEDSDMTSSNNNSLPVKQEPIFKEEVQDTGHRVDSNIVTTSVT